MSSVLTVVHHALQVRESHWLTVEHTTAAWSLFLLTPCALLLWYFTAVGAHSDLESACHALINHGGQGAFTLLGVSTLEFVGLGLSTLGYQLSRRVITATLLNFLQIPIACCLQHFAWHDRLDGFSLTGMGLVMLSGMANLLAPRAIREVRQALSPQWGGQCASEQPCDTP